MCHFQRVQRSLVQYLLTLGQYIPYGVVKPKIGLWSQTFDSKKTRCFFKQSKVFGCLTERNG